MGEPIFSSVSLDYIPALRNIAVFEEMAIKSFEALKEYSSDDEHFTSHSRRRSTRRRGGLVRDHYFSALETYEQFNHEEVCKDFASMKLTF